jgi:hypothetical protein
MWTILSGSKAAAGNAETERLPAVPAAHHSDCPPIKSQWSGQSGTSIGLSASTLIIDQQYASVNGVFITV